MNKQNLRATDVSLKLTGAVVSVAEVLQYIQSDCFFTRQESAKYLKISPRRLDNCKSLVRYRIPGSNRVLFKRSDLDSFLVPVYPSEKKPEALPEIGIDRPELDRMANDFRSKFLTKGRKK